VARPDGTPRNYQPRIRPSKLLCERTTLNSNIGRDLGTRTLEGDLPWKDLVERVRAGDPTGMEELYLILSRGIRYVLYRQCGPQDVDDKVHDILLILTQSIQRGDLREPERLMGYVRTVVHRQVASHIDSMVKSRRNHDETDLNARLPDRQPNPERLIIQQENQDLAMRVLKGLNQRAREVLIRFYLEEQPAERICREMGLTETQFRLIKSRAKARFGELGRARMAPRTGPGRSQAEPERVACLA
jgi:RNA polymerase sigma-70 factor, ECF subfamily